MYNGYKVVDVHGHMTTPAPFRQFLAERLDAAFENGLVRTKIQLESMLP